MSGWDTVLFVALPYTAIIVFLLGTIYRYRATKFGYSSLSSQFLEGKTQFWGSVPFHIGILVIFFGHLIAFLVPSGVLAWNAHPVRLLILEISALAFALCMLVGLGALIYRRLTNERVRMVTSPTDIIIELLLFGEACLGIWVALGFRWGSSWFASDLTPYLWSLFTLQPDVVTIAAMPLAVKLHLVGAFLIFLLFPFTRLVHILVTPLHYIGRPWQQVIWNWDPKEIRNPDTVWAEKRPKNN